MIAHLKDPNTRSRDLPALVAALGELGDAAAGEPLADFFRLYHADPIDEHLVAALELVPAALLEAQRTGRQARARDGHLRRARAYGVRQKASAALDTLLAQQEAARRRATKQKQAEEEQQVAAETAGRGPSRRSCPRT